MNSSKQALAVALTVLLFGNCFARTRSSNLPTLKEQVRTIAPNSPVEVRFLDGSKLRGWISDLSESGFVLSHETKRRLEKSPVTFDQVQAVKQVNSVKPSHKVRTVLILTGIGVGVAAVIVVGAVKGFQSITLGHW